MDQHLLEELYGVSEDQTPELDEETIKEAQAELIEAVANEAGIDLNELDDEELDKFAEYVLSDDEDVADDIDPRLAEADMMGRQMAHSYADEQAKIASAMLEEGDSNMEDGHYYEDEYGDVQFEDSVELEDILEDSLEKQAHLWEMTKEAAEQSRMARMRASASQAMGRAGQKVRSAGRRIAGSRVGKAVSGSRAAKGAASFGRGIGSDLKASRSSMRRLMQLRKKGMEAAPGIKKAIQSGRLSPAEGQKMLRDIMKSEAKLGLKSGARGAGKIGLGVAAGYGAYRGAKSIRNRMKKQSSYELYDDLYELDPNIEYIQDLDGAEFAKLAELRAAEILVANGVDPETFNYVEPEHVKLAEFPEPEDAEYLEDAQEIAEYNELLDDAALDILEDLGLFDEE